MKCHQYFLLGLPFGLGIWIGRATDPRPVERSTRPVDAGAACEDEAGHTCIYALLRQLGRASVVCLLGPGKVVEAEGRLYQLGKWHDSLYFLERMAHGH